ncbi:MAG TPA: HAD family hydrolase [Anaerolineae bacterium]|nr:HAD family hydrolase [Anaerolineae bacterium]
MIEIEVPGRGTYRLKHVVLDVNGTIAVDGRLVEGVAKRVAELRRSVEVHMLTADTRGRQQVIDAQLGMQAARITPQDEAAQKASFVRELGGESVCAVGNGANDAGMLHEAGLGIAVLGEEGLAVETLNAADAVVPSVTVALDLLLKPLRLVATLRR